MSERSEETASSAPLAAGLPSAALCAPSQLALPPPTSPTLHDYATLLARYSEAQRVWEAALPVDAVEAAERMHEAWRALARARNVRLGGL